jgi:hypothetical protein
MNVDLPGPIDLTKGPVSIKLDSQVHAFGFIVLLGLTGVFVFVFLSDSYSVSLRVMSFVCAVLSLLMVLLITPQYIRIYVKKLPALTLTSEGFINYLVSPSLVPWTDVKNCSVKNLGTTQLPSRTLVVELKPGALDHLVMPRYLRMAYFNTSLVFIGDLDCSLEELAEVFESHAKQQP